MCSGEVQVRPHSFGCCCDFCKCSLSHKCSIKEPPHTFISESTGMKQNLMYHFPVLHVTIACLRSSGGLQIDWSNPTEALKALDTRDAVSLLERLPSHNAAHMLTESSGADAVCQLRIRSRCCSEYTQAFPGGSGTCALEQGNSRNICSQGFADDLTCMCRVHELVFIRILILILACCDFVVMGRQVVKDL